MARRPLTGTGARVVRRQASRGTERRTFTQALIRAPATAVPVRSRGAAELLTETRQAAMQARETKDTAHRLRVTHLPGATARLRRASMGMRRPDTRRQGMGHRATAGRAAP
jgi:hypothetical protein